MVSHTATELKIQEILQCHWITSTRLSTERAKSVIEGYIWDHTFRVVHSLLFEHPIICRLCRHNTFLACLEWKLFWYAPFQRLLQILQLLQSLRSEWRLSRASKLFWVYSYLFPCCVSVCGESLSSLRCSSAIQQQFSEMIITNSIRTSIIVICRWVIMSSPPQGFGRSTTVTQTDLHNKKLHICD